MSQDTKFRIRLVTTEYRNSLEREDGPGSLQNVVSSSSSSSRTVGEMTLASAKSLTKANLECMGFYFYEDSDDGFEEYGYKLEYLDPVTDEWRYAKGLR